MKVEYCMPREKPRRSYEAPKAELMQLLPTDKMPSGCSSDGPDCGGCYNKLG